MAQTAKKIEPMSQLLSISEIAKRLKLHRQTVSQRLDDLGYEPDESSTAKNQLYAFDDEMEFAVKAAKDSLTAAKIRELRARTEKIEMQNAKERGELVPIGEVVDLSQKLTRSLYDEYAMRIPKRIGGQLVKAKTQAAVRKIFKTESDKVFKLIRANFKRYIDG